MVSDTTPRLALDLQFDDKHRLTWKSPLREKIPDSVDGLRVVWNEDEGCYEAYPIED